MPFNSPWQVQPPHLTPIRSEFSDSSLQLALEGYGLPEYYKPVSSISLQARSVTTGSSKPAGALYAYSVSSAPALPIRLNTISINNDVLFEFLANMSWTFMCRIYNGTGSGTNPGFWRNDSTQSGNIFFINNGSARRPWIRVNGVDILKATSGDQWPSTGGFTMLARFVNATSADVWWDGLKRHSATHSTGQNSATGSTNGVVAIGVHSAAEYVSGQYSAIRFWSKALSDGQCARLTTNPWEFYRAPLRKVFTGVSAAGGGFFARPYYDMIGQTYV